MIAVWYAECGTQNRVRSVADADTTIQNAPNFKIGENLNPNKKEPMMSSKKQKPTSDKSAAPKSKRAEKTKPGKKRSIKTIVRDAFISNPEITNDQIAAMVKKARPDSSFNEKQAQWYRWMAKKGTLTGTAIVMPRKARAKKAGAAHS
jgi:hypothetical protein